jgi:hypothetical protein
MGWSTGSLIFEQVITTVEENVEDYDVRVKLYSDLIEVFEDYDCDNLMECMGTRAFDKAMREVRPDYFEDEEVFEEDDE